MCHALCISVMMMMVGTVESVTFWYLPLVYVRVCYSKFNESNVIKKNSHYPPTDSNGELSESMRFPRVEWKPYLATAPSRTPILHHHSPRRTHHPLLGFEDDERDTAVAVLPQAEYPFGEKRYNLFFILLYKHMVISQCMNCCSPSFFFVN